jgi:hypothetical protein
MKTEREMAALVEELASVCSDGKGGPRRSGSVGGSGVKYSVHFKDTGMDVGAGASCVGVLSEG